MLLYEPHGSYERDVSHTVDFIEQFSPATEAGLFLPEGERPCSQVTLGQGSALATERGSGVKPCGRLLGGP